MSLPSPVRPVPLRVVRDRGAIDVPGAERAVADLLVRWAATRRRCA